MKYNILGLILVINHAFAAIELKKQNVVFSKEDIKGLSLDKWQIKKLEKITEKKIENSFMVTYVCKKVKNKIQDCKPDRIEENYVPPTSPR